MKQKISIFILVLTTMIAGANAQSAQNQLSQRSVNVRVCRSATPKVLKEYIIYNADDTNKQKDSYEYNEAGLKSSMLFQTWNKSANQWNNNTKYIYSYNTENVLIEKITTNFTIDNWRNNSKTTYTYIDGKLSEELESLWNSKEEKWDEVSGKVTYTYNEEGFNIETTSSTKNKETDEWTPQQRDIQTFNPAGFITEGLLQTWARGTNEWSNDRKDEYNYDATTHKMDVLTYNWENNQWNEQVKQKLFYNNEGDLERFEYYSTFDDSSMGAYGIYTYTTLEEATGSATINTEVISVYPNPATTYINLQITSSLLSKKAELYDTAGRLIKTILCENEVTNVDISELSVGIYFIKIDNQTKKIIKQ